MRMAEQRRPFWLLVLGALIVQPVNERPNPYQRIHPWGELPAGTRAWAAVIGAEPGPDGHLYVMHRCFENSCAGRSEPPILKLDRSGTLLASWGAGMFTFPHGFHVDREGNVWATDTQANLVVKFTNAGKLLMKLEAFAQPTDVVTTSSGEIFVTEGHGGPINRVSKLAKDGRVIKTWGTNGAGPGELNAPHTIALDSRGRLFVGDRSNNRIQIFDQEGKYLDQWKQFSRPSGIYITSDDTIYVADSESWGPDNPGWKKGIRIGSARDGSIKYFIEDIESTAIEHSGAEGVGVDADGHVYGAVVRRKMLEKFVKR